ncbi:tetrahydrobiopterin biosynthesis enzymes-like protein [Basidiobolus meristosporus CBS 931.73]|uniref:factor independent urate hydroxylase n=1 Tax=Basidiobolus meristosporus CBS 931.73 TaxID=1314790 RepID=A0A1Y1VTM0_9FUNG|nr:tetrahydrobiopterin biosynthesis enzymes-like protein [Basidiobolus meristosporus CBS 931.73]|eukprot:ORX64533.1 tetrahydrobiopterin biosynthesis enzymes-like protein [Basidiobolus meristosporus CBS 931.73]
MCSRDNRPCTLQPHPGHRAFCLRAWQTDKNSHVVQRRWTRINVNSEPHPHSFYRNGSETRETWVTVAADSVNIKSGLEGLLGLKATGSSFSNFHLCENTTLQDADDRIFFTTVNTSIGVENISFDRIFFTTVNTSIGVENISFDRIFVGVRETTLDVFAHEDSTSTQATLCCTAGLILKRSPEVQDVYYALHNSHHFTTNLAHSNLPNAGSEITII